jgi:hypothetical protein
MLDVALHVGTGHPGLLWILVPSLLAFAAGLGIGLYRKPDRDETETVGAVDGNPG